MKRSLMVFLTVLLVLAMILGSAMVLGGAPDFSSLGDDEGNYQLSIPPQVWENNTKLIEVSERLVLADMAALGISLAGFYVDPWTATIYVGLTEIKDEYTEPIKAIVNEVDGVKLEFFEVKYTETELKNLKRKITEAVQDETLKGVPLISWGVDIKNNTLRVGFRELKPQYIEAIRKVAGAEAPIEFIEEELSLLRRTDRHRPVIGGIQLHSWSHHHGAWVRSTSGFRATRTDGTLGMVMTGHAGWSGHVWQPIRNPSWPWQNRLGTITNPHINVDRRSDAAFVSYNNVASRLYPAITIVGWKPSPHAIGTFVRREGIGSSPSIGRIQRIGNVNCEVYRQVLENQVWVGASAFPGDSGGPVFTLDVSGNARIFGIVTRGSPTTFIYSPVSNIASDLSLRWGS